MYILKTKFHIMFMPLSSVEIVIITLVIILATVLIIILFGTVSYLPELSKTSETYCEQDKDCACGININTGGCFYGKRQYVNTQKQCPDFCSGFAGNLIIKCVNNECKQISTS